MPRTVLLLLALVTSALHANAADSMQTFSVSLLQPEHVLQERVSNVSDLSNYLEAVEVNVGKVVATITPHQPASGFIVVAVRPGQKSNAWLDIAPPLSQQEASKLLDAAKSVRPFSAKGGVVLVGLKVGLWGGSEVAAVSPFPAEWRAAANAAGKPMEVGALVEMVWHE